MKNPNEEPGNFADRMARIWDEPSAPRAVAERAEPRPVSVEAGPGPGETGPGPLGSPPTERPFLGEDDVRGDVTLGIPDRPPVRGFVVLTAILACVLILVVLLVVLVKMLPEATSSSSGAEPTVASPAGPPVAGEIGRPLRLGPLALVVHGIREIPGSASERPEPGMRWVAVEIEVLNESDDEQDISMLSMFDVETADGESWSPTIIGSVPDYVEGRLAPETRLQGEAVFEIPLDAEARYLLITSPDRSAEATVSLRPAED